MSDDKLKEIIAESIEEKLKEHFNRGLMTGWDACIYEISKQIAPLTSAKAIKDLIKAKVGEADGREVDFIAEDQSGITYIQVAETLSAPGVEEREFSAFAAVPDSYPRLVLSMDELDYSQGGVRHVHVVDWLLQEL